ncbi:MAG: Transketolase, thiamine diphosphate binding domain-containing protein [Piptocephalis tieghemiana]|nr:MAG: Transketolase, thiamine diphosphate binding domain-containing protein [Piptocephalis tieghemiana]
MSPSLSNKDQVAWKAINAVRCLAADAVCKANSGHPGAPMGLAPTAYTLWSQHMRFSAKHSNWINRDRFVLSNGHACALQYTLLHLLGYKVGLEDLKQFRQLNSITPGHPERGHTDGIEVTTGPLGQGFSNAVGFALAESHLAAIFNRPDFPIIDNHTYVFAGDGCLQEGVASEAASLAGHLQLGKLICIYDDNHISIDGDINVAFTEDVLARFAAYGWHTQAVDDGNEDLESISKAIDIAKSVTDKPSIIKVRTTIGFGSLIQGTGKVHGAPLSADDLAQVKERFGFDPKVNFHVPSDAQDTWSAIAKKGEEAYESWSSLFSSYQNKHPELAEELMRRFKGHLPTDWKKSLPTFTPADKAVATRKLSEGVLNALCPLMPELMGGSADLTGSNLTRWQGAEDFQPESTGLGSRRGRYIRYGVREHGMAGVSNGLAAYGGVIPFCATFLNFISYALGSVRLSALSKSRIIYIMTHDSIGLGEDGPTHQPVETLAGLRALPDLLVLRPADGNEVSGAYAVALENFHRPSVICLTRQGLPHLEGSSIDAVYKGAYALPGPSSPKIILTATGSEVPICVDTAKILESQGIPARVVSFPCWELFEEQPQEYRESVFPKGIPVMSVEAMSTCGWSKYAHASYGLNTFGMSAPYQEIYKKLGLDPENLANKAKEVVQFYTKEPIAHLVAKPF